MSLELQATTTQGKRLVALAESLAAEIEACAGVYDREGSYPFKSFDTLKRHGYFRAPIPEQLGGLGATSVRDVLIASSRLARGDASLAIGVNMHFVYVLNVVRRWQMAVGSGNGRRASALGEALERIARDGVVFAAAGSEIGQDLTRPGTTARRTESGWLVSGRKVFCTMSPAADVLYASVTFTDEEGSERYGYAMIPRTTPGVTVHDDWDALGMRASGSHSVSFDDVELPASALRGGFPVGEVVPYMERNLIAGLFHASAAMGIAESAHATAVRKLAERNGNAGARNGVLVAESAIDLSACRAALDRAARLIDEHRTAYPVSDGPDDELTALFAEAQAVKAFISQAAPRIVDRALALSGGAGYLNGSPIARAYRDVRAGAFMHPLGDNRAYELLEQAALGRELSLH
ncbi:MAG TPA: acyl-CoA dehydrogenase family protein [Gaiellaceae bacterium]|jgi:alkylation response protein AidB-like acyl-CoA dehydrogenase